MKDISSQKIISAVPAELKDFKDDAIGSKGKILLSSPLYAVFSDGSLRSSYALNPEFLSLEGLVEDGLLKEADLHAELSRMALLQKAHQAFHEDFNFMTFSFQEWMHNDAVFTAFEKVENKKPWSEWDKSHRCWPQGTEQVSIRDYSDDIFFEIFQQYELFLQWKKLKQHLMDEEIQILGQIVLQPGRNSIDAWSHQECFAADGFDWNNLEKEQYAYLTDRFSYAERLYDGAVITGWRDRTGTDWDYQAALEALKMADPDLKLGVREEEYDALADKLGLWAVRLV